MSGLLNFVVVILVYVSIFTSIQSQTIVVPCGESYSFTNNIPTYWIEGDKPRYEFRITLLYETGQNTLYQFHPETFHYWSHIALNQLPDSLSSFLVPSKAGTWSDDFFELTGNYAAFTFKYNGRDCVEALSYLKIIEHLLNFQWSESSESLKDNFFFEIAGSPYKDAKVLFYRYGLGLDSISNYQLSSQSLERERILMTENSVMQSFTNHIQKVNKSVLLVGNFESCICNHTEVGDEIIPALEIPIDPRQKSFVSKDSSEVYFLIQDASVGVPTLEVSFRFSEFMMRPFFEKFFFLAELKHYLLLLYQINQDAWKQSVIQFNIRQELSRGNEILFLFEFAIKREEYSSTVEGILDWIYKTNTRLLSDEHWLSVREDLVKRYDYMNTYTGRPSHEQIVNFWILGMTRIRYPLSFSHLYRAYQAYQSEWPIDRTISHWRKEVANLSPKFLFVVPDTMKEVGEWSPANPWKAE